MDHRFTVLIAARNAAATIDRAIRSVRDQAPVVVLVDDGSTDDTVARARVALGGPLLVVSCEPSATGGPLGATRQAGLSQVTTPFAAWLDADDEFTPNRLARLTARLEAGADIVADATTLVDGPTGAHLRDVPLPDWVRDDVPPARLFGRNALPAIGLVGFRTSAWQALGYDETFHGAEDVDILLRAAAATRRFHWVHEPGTRVHVYANSLSRRRDAQRASYARALRKHAYEDVRALHLLAGDDEHTIAHGLASMAMFRDEPHRTLAFVEEAARAEGTTTWLTAFMRGVAQLLIGDDAAAVEALRHAEDLLPTPEGANNLGVALSRLGRLSEARACFHESAARLPVYEDARVNALADVAERITTHPLRARL